MADGDEILKGAGRFFSKLGGQLKEAGGQLKEVGKTVGNQVVATGKQVTGLGRGSVKLELEQTKATPGGTIKGKFILSVTEPIEAKRALVTLRARQRYIAVKRGDGGGVGSSHADVYQFDKELAPSGTFEPNQTFEFELVVPPDALELRPQQSAGGNPLSDVVRTVASAVTPNAGPIEWQVIGRLEISWGRDLSHDVDIIIAR
jgi:hypothetical protein